MTRAALPRALDVVVGHRALLGFLYRVVKGRVARRITAANARRNGVDDRVAATRTPLRDVGRRFDLTIANLGGTLAPLALLGVALVIAGVVLIKD